MTPPYLPNGEKVAVAFLASLTPVAVSTTLPGDLTKWTAVDTGKARFFVTTAVVGGAPDPYVPMRHPVVQVSVWGYLVDSDKTPWGQTQAVAEDLFTAFAAPTALPFRATWTNYRPALIETGYVLTEPRSIPGAEAGYAQVQFDAAISWLVA